MKSSSPDLDRYVIEGVVESIERGEPYITFGDLAEIITNKRGKRINASGSRFALKRIQEYCNELGLPALSAMVVKEKRSFPVTIFSVRIVKCF